VSDSGIQLNYINEPIFSLCLRHWLSSFGANNVKLTLQTCDVASDILQITGKEVIQCARFTDYTQCNRELSRFLK
jgi:hypothetical protein